MYPSRVVRAALINLKASSVQKLWLAPARTSGPTWEAGLHSIRGRVWVVASSDPRIDVMIALMHFNIALLLKISPHGVLIVTTCRWLEIMEALGGEMER